MLLYFLDPTWESFNPTYGVFVTKYIPSTPIHDIYLSHTWWRKTWTCYAFHVVVTLSLSCECGFKSKLNYPYSWVTDL